MSEQLVIDPAKFAQRAEHLAGTLPLAALTRLQDQLWVSDPLYDPGRDEFGRAPDPDHTAEDQRHVGAAASRSIHYDVTGFVSARGHPALHLALEADLLLPCQRCLGALPYHLEVRRDIVFVPGGDEFAPMSDEAETEDIIPQVPRLDLRALLEEEVLLGLPLAPMHEDEACAAFAGHAEPDPGSSPGSSPADGNDSPFAVLARLKKQ